MSVIYQPPDPARLISASARYRHPADHPFFRANPVSAGNVVRAWDLATAEEKAEGMRWYTDARAIATAISGGDAAKGAGLLAAYSPQTTWHVSMMHASQSLHQGRALGPGDGKITGHMQAAAQRILDGQPAAEVLAGPKTSAFAHLIEHDGDTSEDGLGRVVVDRHALSVAAGRRLSSTEVTSAPIDQRRYYEHVADQFRQAAITISERDAPVSPHQVQAATWLYQLTANQQADLAPGGNRGRVTAAQHAREQWAAHSESMQRETSLITADQEAG